MPMRRPRAMRPVSSRACTPLSVTCAASGCRRPVSSPGTCGMLGPLDLQGSEAGGCGIMLWRMHEPPLECHKLWLSKALIQAHNLRFMHQGENALWHVQDANRPQAGLNLDILQRNFQDRSMN